ncbi:MAG TPA: isopentenyl-diphosphate Delta-isomerase [Bacteroidales bacterium]|nr:isopentenyl-diphosphate Delta-isomerase [Bacteroidales bacterium]
MSKTYVILVDSNDNQVGVEEKMAAHEKALLHRAVSVFIINSKGEWLLQQRAMDKYHSKGLWTNTCCSHPFPGESTFDAAARRLQEEMGLKAGIKEVFSFLYREDLDNGLTEHELDHVFVGYSDELPVPNADEVMAWKYIAFDDLKTDISSHPDNYTVWFKMIFEKVNKHL